MAATNHSLPILVVDDEFITLESMGILLKSEGFDNVILCQDGREVAVLLNRNRVGAVLLDLVMPHISGEEILSMLSEEFPEIPVIVLSAINRLETAVSCMRANAYDYIVKPIDPSRLLMTLRRAIQYRAMRTEINLHAQSAFHDDQSTHRHDSAFSDIVTRNREFYNIFRYIEAICESSHPVLITGETGAGKELIARAVHKCNGRKGEFVAVSIAGVDENIFSDMLFGHRKGAFTSADSSRRGLVEIASEGTLFLDEIGDLGPEPQIKLLRLIQEGEYFPLGSSSLKKANARIIAATNRDLKKKEEEKSFRRDLYYRFNYHHIHVPPLREHIEDLPLLVDHFLETASEEYGKKKPKAPMELIPLLSAYHYPGNVRELKSMVYDAVALHKAKMLNLDSFRKHIKKNMDKGEDVRRSMLLKEASNLSKWERLPTIREMTGMLVDEAMKRTQGNQSVASQMLGVNRQTLMRHMKRHNSDASSDKN